MQLAPSESGVAKHLVVLRKRICVSTFGGTEHHEAKCRRHRRRDAILVRHKLHGSNAATRFERGIYLAKQRFAGRDIEVMEEIRQERDVVPAAEWRFKGAAGKRLVTGGYPGLGGMLFGDLEHFIPVSRYNCGIRILPGKG